MWLVVLTWELNACSFRFAKSFPLCSLARFFGRENRLENLFASWRCTVDWQHMPLLYAMPGIFMAHAKWLAVKDAIFENYSTSKRDKIYWLPCLSQAMQAGWVNLNRFRVLSGKCIFCMAERGNERLFLLISVLITFVCSLAHYSLVQSNCLWALFAALKFSPR